MPTCKICNNSNGNTTYLAKEMMFGYRDEFEYLECKQCGCVQILEVPSNISKYYPPDYYSFETSSPHLEKKSWLKKFAGKQRSKHYLGYGSWVGKILAKRCGTLGAYKDSSLHFFDWLKQAKVRLDYKILDVGCGSGYHLLELQKNGFPNLTGIDPFIENDIFYKNGVSIFKKEIYEIQEQFDFIMLNHSFEHMQDPLLVLKQLYQILKPNRYALIRIPVSSSFAWSNYQTNWVQLDAPRHLFLHTVDSLKMIATQAGFQLDKVIHDSTEFQFCGSERYMKDLSLLRSEESIDYTQAEFNALKQKADRLNLNSEGDQACFYLCK